MRGFQCKGGKVPVRPLLAVRKIQGYDSLVPSTTSDSYLVAKDVVVDDLCDNGFSGSNEIWDLKARRRYYPQSVKFVSHSMYITINIYTHTHTNYPNKHYT